MQTGLALHSAGRVPYRHAASATDLFRLQVFEQSCTARRYGKEAMQCGRPRTVRLQPCKPLPGVIGESLRSVLGRPSILTRSGLQNSPLGFDEGRSAENSKSAAWCLLIRQARKTHVEHSDSPSKPTIGPVNSRCVRVHVILDPAPCRHQHSRPVSEGGGLEPKFRAAQGMTESARGQGSQVVADWHELGV